MASKSTLVRKKRVHATRETVGWLFIALVLFLSLVVFKPSLPDKIVLLTGPQGSSYHAVGMQYAALLGERGLTAEVVTTDGGMDNIRRLVDSDEATVAFAPSNLELAIHPPIDSEHLVTLGGVAFEPFWFFYRSDLKVGGLRDVARLTVATGDDDSVVGWLATRLLDINGVLEAVDFVAEIGTTPKATADALLGGVIDGVFAMGLPTTPTISSFLHTDGISVLSFNRADAYAALTPGLTKLVAPEGVFDLARNVPPEDAQLLAATTNIVSTDAIHPIVVSTLLGAARSIHENQNIFAGARTFPTPDGVSLPLHKAAVRFYDQGETGLAKHVPYTVARYLRHFGGVVLPLLALAVILIKFLPVVLKIWITVRLAVLYKRLVSVEKADAGGDDRADLLAQLQEIDDASSGIFVPRSKLAEYIDFRQFIHDMRDRINSGEERRLKAEVLGSKDDS